MLAQSGTWHFWHRRHSTASQARKVLSQQLDGISRLFLGPSLSQLLLHHNPLMTMRALTSVQRSCFLQLQKGTSDIPHRWRQLQCLFYWTCGTGLVSLGTESVWSLDHRCAIAALCSPEHMHTEPRWVLPTGVRTSPWLLCGAMLCLHQNRCFVFPIFYLPVRKGMWQTDISLPSPQSPEH